MLSHDRQFHRDAACFLATTLVVGAALSLYWIDFNLYLASLGYSTATIGLVATVGSTAGALTAFPASALSDRIGRRAVMASGIVIALLALVGLLLVDALPLIIVFVALWAIGQQSLMVVQAPFLTEHSAPEHRTALRAAGGDQSVTTRRGRLRRGWWPRAGRRDGDRPERAGHIPIILVIKALLLTAAGHHDRARRPPRRLRGAGRLRELASQRHPVGRLGRARLMGVVVRDRSRLHQAAAAGLLMRSAPGR